MQEDQTSKLVILDKLWIFRDKYVQTNITEH